MHSNVPSNPPPPPFSLSHVYHKHIWMFLLNIELVFHLWKRSIERCLILHSFKTFNAEANFGQSTRMQDFRKPSKPCCVGIHWIALWVLSDEYPYAGVSVIFKDFLHHFALSKLATSSMRVKYSYLKWVTMVQQWLLLPYNSIGKENQA